MMAQLVQFVLYQQIKGSFMKTNLLNIVIILLLSITILAQRPPRRDDRLPQGLPPFPQNQPPMRENNRDNRDEKRQQPHWLKDIDTNDNKKIERNEYQDAANNFFSKFDKNRNDLLEQNELPPPQQGNHPQKQDNKGVPLFLFLERGEFNLTKSDFDNKVNLRFIMFDVDANSFLEGEEIKGIRPPNKPPMPNVAMAEFIGAEMRFGDKLVKDSPFSAETLREENKRLFDGSIIKHQSKGLIYRDSLGRSRQEQPIEKIGGFAVLGENNQPKRLVNIVDVVSGNFYSLDFETKTYFNVQILSGSPLKPRNESKDTKKESLGTKNFEGVNAEGTRLTIEIPVGQIGNDKPIFVVTEKWFSNELQMIVFSKHTDPFIGEVTFQLINIKQSEPSQDLFVIPKDFKIKNLPKRGNRED